MTARVLLVAALLAASLTYAAPPDIDSAGATIICYHVVESPYDTEFSISREAFLQQMQYLSATGYNVISLAHLHEYISGQRKSIPRNAVVITVDDGYRCVYTEMYPILKKYRFPFTVFIYPKWIGQSSYALTWKQVEAMAVDGVDVQSHSLSHAFLTKRRRASADQATYSQWLQTELERSKEMIEEHTGHPVRFLAYPYGDYDTTVAARASAAGYDGALTCDFGPVRKGADPFRLKRIVVRKNTTLAAFRQLLGAGSLSIQVASPKPGEEFERETPVIAAKIPNHKALDPNSVQMSLLSLGRTPFAYDPRDGSISLVVRDELRGNVQRAFVWGTDAKTGKRVEGTWTFYLNKPQPKAVPLPPAAPAETTAGAAEVSVGSRSPLGQRR